VPEVSSLPENMNISILSNKYILITVTIEVNNTLYIIIFLDQNDVLFGSQFDTEVYEIVKPALYK
jgi:hypothetical protein